MALLFADGFDYYTTADLVKKWSAVYTDNNAVSPSIVAQGRFGTGTGAVQMGGYGTAGLNKIISSTPGGIVIGFAFKTSISSIGRLLTVYSSSGTTQAYINFNNGILAYTNGARNTYTASSATAIPVNTWNYIEFKTTPNASTAASMTQVRLNGVVVIDVPAGTNTIGDSSYPTPIATMNRLVLDGSYFLNIGTGANGSTVYFDDFYLCDNTGSNNNDFLGDVRIETLFPNAAGDLTQFTPTSGSNYTCVSETPEDGDTSYVSASAIGTEDLYNLADLSSNPTSVKGIQISTIARKDDAGSRIIQPVVKSSGTEYTHTAQFGLADGYTQNLDVWEQNPATSSAWTGTTINALQIGVKVVG